MSALSRAALLAAAAAAASCGGASAEREPLDAGPERIAYVSAAVQNVDIYAVRADGRGKRRLTDDRGRDEAPAWSRDGTRIAFVSDRDHNRGSLNRYELYVMDADGSGERRLTNDERAQLRPQWLPDGRVVVAACGRDLRSCRLEAVDPESGRSEPFASVPAPAVLFGAAVSPDGSRLVYTQPARGLFWDASAFDIWTARADGSDARRLTSDPANDGGPVWSPDGRRLAFVSDRDRNGRCLFHDCIGNAGEIYVMNADGSGEQRLTRNPAEDNDPTWSGDGTRIAFARISNESADYDLFVMNADGGCETRITSGREWEWQPDWDQSRGTAGRLGCVDLELTAESGAPFVRRGRTARYRVTLANVGTLRAARVRLSVAVSVGARVVSLRVSAGRCRARAASCALAALAPGNAATITADVRFEQGRVARPTFVVASSAGDPDRTNNRVRFSTVVCTRAGTPGSDRLVGTSAADVLCGFAGDDVLDGRAGDDLLYGGMGDDRLIGGADGDRIERDPGCDTVLIRDGEPDFAWADFDRPPGLVADVGLDRVNIPGECR